MATADRRRTRRAGLREGFAWLGVAARRHRRSARAITAVALVTSLPLALVGAGLDGSELLDFEGRGPGIVALLVPIILADIAFFVLGSTLLSGVFDNYLQVLGDERDDPSPRAIVWAIRAAARETPIVRLVTADVLVTTITVAGLMLFVVPGLVASLLLWLTGPIVTLEDRGPVSAMRRSASLSLRGPIAVAVALIVPAAIWGAASGALDATPYGNLWTLVIGGLVYAPFAALARIVAARRLSDRADRPGSVAATRDA